ncbi:hypothetical protein [Sphingomonas sp. TDK1]|uniref:hypothetical protein n=1 Tax=Sphingomonas sp. TDK1 TaxID=453247 RepID=UPI000A3DB3DB|nr:hypothetical protein [Sphingomonas sp. TDK1]
MIGGRWMPSSSTSLWILSGVVLVAFPVLNFVYWPEVLRAGVLPPDGDSIAIPMFGSILLAAMASPVVLGIAWLCLRQYNDKTRIIAFRPDRLVRSIFSTMVMGGFAGVLLFDALRAVVVGKPWYELLWSGYASMVAVWLLMLRAAVIEQRSRSELNSESIA